MRKDEYAYLQSMRTDHVGKFEGVDKTWRKECNFKEKRGKTVYGLNCDWCLTWHWWRSSWWWRLQSKCSIRWQCWSNCRRPYESIMTSTSRKRKFSLISVNTFPIPQYKHVIHQETLVIKHQQPNRWSKKTKLKDIFASL